MDAVIWFAIAVFVVLIGLPAIGALARAMVDYPDWRDDLPDWLAEWLDPNYLIPEAFCVILYIVLCSLGVWTWL